MSRTDAHVPLHVRVARGDIARVEVHDHTDGVCDLPDPCDHDALWRERGHCHLTWLRLVSTCRFLDGGERFAGCRVERGAGVEDVAAGLDGDAAVAA